MELIVQTIEINNKKSRITEKSLIVKKESETRYYVDRCYASDYKTFVDKRTILIVNSSRSNNIYNEKSNITYRIISLNSDRDWET